MTKDRIIATGIQTTVAGITVGGNNLTQVRRRYAMDVQATGTTAAMRTTAQATGTVAIPAGAMVAIVTGIEEIQVKVVGSVEMQLKAIQTPRIGMGVATQVAAIGITVPALERVMIR